MRVASRPAFVQKESDESESFMSLLGAALGGLIAFALLVGTLAWAFGLTLIDAGAIDSSLSWWTFVRLAGLIHLSRGVLVVWVRGTGRKD